MKAVIAAFAIGSLAVPASAAGPLGLAGVSDEETSIPPGGITRLQYGKGDVLFVSDRADRWYRVQLNEGCMRNLFENDTVVFEQDDATGRIDTFSAVRFVRDGRSCQVASVRSSAAPPQIDSHSPVTLD